MDAKLKELTKGLSGKLKKYVPETLEADKLRVFFEYIFKKKAE